MYLSEIKRMLLKVNDVKTMHFIYVIIKDALEDLDGWETERVLCNLNHHSIGTGGIHLNEKDQQKYYMNRIIEAVNAMTSEKYLKMLFYFAKACYREEKEREA